MTGLPLYTYVDVTLNLTLIHNFANRGFRFPKNDPIASVISYY